MPSNRLEQVEKNLTRLHEQLAGKEDALINIAPEEKVRIKQQIADLKSQMQPYEKEYWEILSQQLGSIEILEQEAQLVVAEFVEQVNEIKVSSSSYPDEVLIHLRQIQDRLNQPGTSAAAKLKGVISSIPPFIGISYEAELDTENFLRKYFPTFISFIDTVVKKKQLS